MRLRSLHSIQSSSQGKSYCCCSLTHVALSPPVQKTTRQEKCKDMIWVIYSDFPQKYSPTKRKLPRYVGTQSWKFMSTIKKSSSHPGAPCHRSSGWISLWTPGKMGVPILVSHQSPWVPIGEVSLQLKGILFQSAFQDMFIEFIVIFIRHWMVQTPNTTSKLGYYITTRTRSWSNAKASTLFPLSWGLNFENFPPPNFHKATPLHGNDGWLRPGTRIFFKASGKSTLSPSSKTSAGAL